VLAEFLPEGKQKPFSREEAILSSPFPPQLLLLVSAFPVFQQQNSSRQCASGGGGGTSFIAFPFFLCLPTFGQRLLFSSHNSSGVSSFQSLLTDTKDFMSINQSFSRLYINLLQLTYVNSSNRLTGIQLQQ